MERNKLRRPELTQLVIEGADFDKQFIGKKLFPVKGEADRAGQYFKLEKGPGGLAKSGGARRAAGAPYPRMKRTFTEDSYVCFEYGLEAPLDATDKAEHGDLIDLEALDATTLARSLMIGHEQRVAAQIMTPANWLARRDPKVNYTEALLGTIDFIFDMNYAIKAMTDQGVIPTDVVLSDDLWLRIQRAPTLAKNIFGSANDKLPELAQVAAKFTIPLNFHVAMAVYDQSEEGADADMVKIWPSTDIWVGAVKDGDFKMGGAGRTIVWDADSPGGLLTTDSYEEDNIRASITRVRMHTAEKVIDPNSGVLIKTNFGA